LATTPTRKDPGLPNLQIRWLGKMSAMHSKGRHGRCNSNQLALKCCQQARLHKEKYAGLLIRPPWPFITAAGHKRQGCSCAFGCADMELSLDWLTSGAGDLATAMLHGWPRDPATGMECAHHLAPLHHAGHGLLDVASCRLNQQDTGLEATTCYGHGDKPLLSHRQPLLAMLRLQLADPALPAASLRLCRRAAGGWSPLAAWWPRLTQAGSLWGPPLDCCAFFHKSIVLVGPPDRRKEPATPKPRHAKQLQLPAALQDPRRPRCPLQPPLL